MSYLRTNYRLTGKELDIDAIGGALGESAGSFAGGPGTNRPFGGFIMGSYNGAAYATYHVISAYGAMSAYYGGGMFNSGYKIFPFMVKNASVPIGGTASVLYFYNWSVSGSLFNIIGIKISGVSISGTGVTNTNALGIASGFASGETIHIIWAGFIVSGP
jgi:hypothetical protein